MKITYATKAWKGDLREVLERHPADLVIGNNLGFRFVDIGETDDFYYLPELEAVKRTKTDYILWYAGDVKPPTTDWVKDALPLLDHYPIVTCRSFGDNIDIHSLKGVKHTDWGWETYHFSDQCYLARTAYMVNINYNIPHPIAKDYPEHGGNSFERRVAQYLAANKTPLAVLKNHRYEHIDRRDK